MKRWQTWLRDVGIGVGLLVLCLYLTFPWDAVKQRLETELAQALSTPQSAAQVVVGSLRPSFGTGVVLEKVMVSRPDPAGGTPKSLMLPEVRARISLLGFLKGQSDATFSAKLFGGKIEGEVVDSKKLSSLDLDVSGLQLAETKDVVAFFGGGENGGDPNGFPIDLGTMDLGGLVNAKVKFSFKPNDFPSLKGVLTLNIDHAMIGGGLPATDIGNVELKTHFQDGKLEVERFEIGGEDVKGETDGVFLVLNQNLGLSMLHGKARVKFGDAYQKKIPVGMILSQALNKQPDRDGYFVLPLGGTLKSPKIL